MKRRWGGAPAAVVLAVVAFPVLAQDIPAPPQTPLPVAATAEFELPRSTLTPHADFKADRLDYDDAEKNAALSGHAEVTDSTWTIKSDSMLFDMERELFTSTVPVQMSDGRTTFDAKDGRFSFAERSGDFSDATITAAPWFFHARDLEVDEGRYYLKHSNTTSCDYVPPHYHIVSSKLTLFPGHWVLAYNNVFYLGSIPILYFPIFWRSLEPDPFFITKLRFGEDSRNGAEIQTDTSFHVNKNVSDSVFLDEYTSQGTGFGDELNYHEKDGSRGSFYAYDIHDTVGQRWTVLGNDYEKLAPDYSMQARIQELSDPEFNNVYMRSNDLRVTQYLDNSIAFMRQDHYTSLRLSADQQQQQDPNNPLQFVRTSEDAPRLDFSVAPIKILGLPVLNTFTAFADRATDDQLNFYENSTGGSWTMTQKIPIIRHLTFVPSAGVSETYFDREAQFEANGSSTVLTNQLNARYFATPSLQYGWYYGETTLGYDYTARLASDSPLLDSNAPNHGIEQNVATIEHLYRPTLTSRFEISGGYNLAEAPRTSTGPYSVNDRIEPVIFDAQVNPSRNVYLSLRETYGVLGGQQSLLVNAGYGAIGSDHVGINLFQSQSDQRTTYVGPAFGWHPKTSTWSIEADIRAAVRSEGGFGDDPHLRAFSAFDDTVTVTKTWHDFIGKFLFRERPGGVLEYTAEFNLRLGKPPQDTKRSEDFQEEMYPWRAGGEDR